MLFRRTIYFTNPGQIDFREEPTPSPGTGEVLVETICSAISPGTEMLVYRGQFPKISDAHDTLSSNITYPVAYGYAAVGKVIAIGENTSADWHDRLVFAFQPHTSHFTAAPNALIPVPVGISPETAAFLPNMETAVNLVQDAAPILGERGLVLGQGIVGLLTAGLLAEFPLAAFVTTDVFSQRRAASEALGVTACLDAGQSNLREAVVAALGGQADFAIEISGAPAALNDALACTGFSGRIIIGSWYGEKKAALDLGGAFHRNRITMIASQVSTIRPDLEARWNKARRFGVAWSALERIRPMKWITHRFSIEKAAEAYHLLDTAPGQTIQILFTY